MSNYFRDCPKCGKTLSYKSKHGFVYSTKNNKLCRTCCQIGIQAGENNPFFGKKHSEETKKKMSENSNQKVYRECPEYKKRMSELTTGINNPMYGKTVYETWLSKYGKEQADIKMAEFKGKQSINSSGKNNPMYGKKTPNGSGNGWSGWYKNTYFRSLRELFYIINHLEKNDLKWQTAEKIKIKYINYDGAERTYSPDFIVENKFLVEIKPEKLHNSPNVQIKKKAEEEYCLTKKLQYSIVDVKDIDFNKIKELHDLKLIRFLPRYEEKFKTLCEKQT